MSYYIKIAIISIGRFSASHQRAKLI